MTYEELAKKLEEHDLYIDDVYFPYVSADRNPLPRILVNDGKEAEFLEPLIKEYNETNDVDSDSEIDYLFWENILTCEECGHYWYNDDYRNDGEWGEYGWYCPDCLKDESICETIIEQKYIDNPKAALMGDLLDNYDLEKYGWEKGERSYSNGWYGHNDNTPTEKVFAQVKDKWEGHVEVLFVVTDKAWNPWETNWMYYYRVEEDYLEKCLDELYPGTHAL